jgi:hypothetical protein
MSDNSRDSRPITAACAISPETPLEPGQAPRRMPQSKLRRSCAIPSMRSRKRPGALVRSPPAPAAGNSFPIVATKHLSLDFRYRGGRATPPQLAAAHRPNIHGLSGVPPASSRHQSPPVGPDIARPVTCRGQRPPARSHCRRTTPKRISARARRLATNRRWPRLPSTARPISSSASLVQRAQRPRSALRSTFIKQVGAADIRGGIASARVGANQ